MYGRKWSVAAWQMYGGFAALVAGGLALLRGQPGLVGAATLAAIYALMALSVGATYGKLGVLSFCQAGFAALGGYIAAKGIGNFWLVGLLLTLAGCAVVGFVLARVVTRLPPLSLVLATLVFGELLVALAEGGGSVTGGYIGLSVGGVGQLSPWDFAAISWVVVLCVVILLTNLGRSVYGSRLLTARANRLRATCDGVNVAAIEAQLFSVGAVIAGVAGWLYAENAGFISPDSLSTSISILVVVMAIVGGVSGKLSVGPVVGAILLTGLDTVLAGTAVSGLVVGALLIVVLAFAGGGLTAFRFRTAISAGQIPGVRRFARDRGRVSDAGDL